MVVMVHGDDKGLVLPPRVAKLQVQEGGDSFYYLTVRPCGAGWSALDGGTPTMYPSLTTPCAGSDCTVRHIRRQQSGAVRPLHLVGEEPGQGGGQGPG